MIKYIFSFTISLLYGITIAAQSFQGNYKLINNTYAATMELESSDNINYTGSIVGSLGQMQVTAVAYQSMLSGNMQSQQGNSYFSFALNNGMYIMTTMNYNMYGQPIAASAVYFYFEKKGVNQQKVVLSKGRAIYFNGAKLENAIIEKLENFYKVKVQNGRYWYDKISGMWGVEGDKTYGIMLPNLPLGGPIKSNASNGNTGVFINGRNLPKADLLLLQSVTGYLQPGRYWIDDQGNAGMEGGPALVNLRQVANQKNGGSTFYRNSYTGIGTGSSGGTFYVIGKDFSYIGGN